MDATHSTYDSYKESGVEWLGTVPQEWCTRKLKFVTQITKRIAGHEGPDVLSITQQGIKVKDIASGEGQLADDYSNYQLVYRGDFAMNHMDLLTGYVDISKFDGVVSPDYRVFRRSSCDLDDQYLLLIFQIGYKQRIFFRYGQGVSLLGRWRFPAENFKEFQIPIPPLPEQRAIVSFLDDKCAKIDGAVKIKEDQIALLRERRQIIIQDAVTRGLNPAAPMKDSGIDWIGQIPAHWEVKRFKHFFSTAMGETILGENLINDGKIPVYSATEGDHFFGYVNKSRVSLSAGDLVIPARGNSIGFPKLVAGPATCSQTTIYAKKLRSISSEFVFFYLLSCKRFLFQFVQTAIPQITVDEVKNNILLLPPPQEQAELVQYCEDITKRFDGAIEIKRRQIDALNEYKTSLINAAVTGKIKVI